MSALYIFACVALIVTLGYIGCRGRLLERGYACLPPLLCAGLLVARAHDCAENVTSGRNIVHGQSLPGAVAYRRDPERIRRRGRLWAATRRVLRSSRPKHCRTRRLPDFGRGATDGNRFRNAAGTAQAELKTTREPSIIYARLAHAGETGDYALSNRP